MSSDVTSILSSPVAALRDRLGLNRSIAYTVLARCVNILGSTVSVLLIVHFLSPVEQGYYYSLLNLVSLQAVFELGFSFVIQQLAAHESVNIRFHENGSFDGDSIAIARLASTLQLTVRWYSRAAILLVGILLPMGYLFFSDAGHTADHVAWQLPWILAATGCCGTFVLAPLYSFVEGCGQIRQVALLRLGEGCAAAFAAWISMCLHRGLYAPAMVVLSQTAVGFIFLMRRRMLLLNLFRVCSEQYRISWRAEVWPFQWKIAVSWICAYFTAQAMVPLLFTMRGPIEAGQFGMSLSITGYLSVLLLPWISTKATPFGQLIAKRDFRGLDILFFRALKQSTILLFLVAAACLGAVSSLPYIFPRLASRMVSPAAFALLLTAMMCVFVVQCLAIFLRSFKREPFLPVYLSTAVASVVLALIAIRRWGTVGAAASYAAATITVGLVFAIYRFSRFRAGRELNV